MHFRQYKESQDLILQLIDRVLQNGDTTNLKRDALLIYKEFNERARFAFEIEQSKCEYTLETHIPIGSEGQINDLCKQLINKQAKSPLNDNDRIVTGYVSIPRQQGRMPMYKITLRKGKSVNWRGFDVHLGQAIMNGQGRFNRNKPTQDRVYVKPNIPYCLRDRADQVGIVASNLRNDPNETRQIFTKVAVKYERQTLELLIKTKEGNDVSNWRTVDNTPNLDPNLVTQYTTALNTRLKIYIPRNQRQHQQRQQQQRQSSTVNSPNATSPIIGRGNNTPRNHPARSIFSPLNPEHGNNTNNKSTTDDNGTNGTLQTVEEDIIAQGGARAPPQIGTVSPSINNTVTNSARGRGGPNARSTRGGGASGTSLPSAINTRSGGQR